MTLFMLETFNAATKRIALVHRPHWPRDTYTMRFVCFLHAASRCTRIWRVQFSGRSCSETESRRLQLASPQRCPPESTPWEGSPLSHTDFSPMSSRSSRGSVMFGTSQVGRPCGCRRKHLHGHHAGQMITYRFLSLEAFLPIRSKIC